ncbi:nuclear transport factor 2 family protein [Lacibacter sediminis]|uniref:Nuclear transport factor 2 family protein n=1 Tax=Lacibacter sediminis TaxID=2760713 RepID=A0A7G5XK60_9BACT|nr:nuclear transport factor 2 family protein [Lacibacter sediminis]QNA45863.1 nuclear transport factor 2 family protein [Lacibacter sediminis]
MQNEQSTTDELIGNFLQRLSNYDAEGVAALFDEQIDWYVPGDTSLPWVGQRSQRAEVADYFNTMWPHFEKGKSIVTLNHVLVSGTEVVLIAHFQHTVVSTGKTFQTPAAFHLTISNAKISRLHLYEDTLTVSRAFF